MWARRLVEGFHPQRIILFGSAARRDHHARSDVDLPVVCPVGDSRRKLMVAMDRALSGRGFARDIVVVTPEEFARDLDVPGAVVRPAAREGKVLHDRTD